MATNGAIKQNSNRCRTNT